MYFPLNFKFKAYYLDVFTEYTLSKIYNTYNRAKNLSDQETGSVTKMLRNVNPELKKVIGNAILEVFSTVDLTAASSDIITPVIAKINAYLQAHPSLPEIVSIKSLPKKVEIFYHLILLTKNSKNIFYNLRVKLSNIAYLLYVASLAFLAS